MNRTLPLALALIALLGGATDARAEGPRAEARAIAEEGDVQFYAGRCDKAVTLWRRAFEVYRAPTILLRVAHCEALVGRVVAAAATLEEILVEEPQPDPPAAFTAARDEARRELPLLRARIATLRVDVLLRGADPSPAAAVDVEVEVDGAPAPTNGGPIPLDPGAHRLRVRAARTRWEREVRLDDGESRTIDVPLLVEPLPTVSPRQRTAGLVAFGVGMASLVTGVDLAVSALSATRAIDAACGPAPARCPPSEQGARARAHAYAIAADAALAGGGVLVVGGAVLLTTDLRSRRESGVRILASPRGLFVSGPL